MRNSPKVAPVGEIFLNKVITKVFEVYGKYFETFTPRKLLIDTCRWKKSLPKVLFRFASRISDTYLITLYKNKTFAKKFPANFSYRFWASLFCIKYKSEK